MTGLARRYSILRLSASVTWHLRVLLPSHPRRQCLAAPFDLNGIGKGDPPMPRRTPVAITILAISMLSGLAFTNAFALAASPHHFRASSSDRMLPFNAGVPEEPSKRLFKGKRGQKPTLVERQGRARSVTTSPLSSPTNGSSDSPACIPAELC
jgi:hypothetical protein